MFVSTRSPIGMYIPSKPAQGKQIRALNLAVAFVMSYPSRTTIGRGGTFPTLAPILSAGEEQDDRNGGVSGACVGGNGYALRAISVAAADSFVGLEAIGQQGRA